MPTFKIVVVGGGPAGAAVAMALAKKGHTVDLYEAYPHPLTIEKNAPKAYVISLSKRGQNGLQRATGIKLEEVKGGLMTANLARHPSQKLMQRPAPALIVPRQTLTAHVLDEAEKAGVNIHFEHRLTDIDFEKKVAIFETLDSKKKVEAKYDLLVGADGAKSQVRTLLDAGVDDFSVERTEVDSMEYQVAVLPIRLFTDKLPVDTVHAWNNKEYNAICLAFPVSNNSTLFATVFPEGKLDEFKATHKETGKGYDDPLASLFPDLDEQWRQELAAQYVQGQPANGVLCVWCDAMGSVKSGVVLVGDSAHGMWPSLGQGANCALETAAIFCETVRDVSTSTTSASEWSSAVIKEFNQRRHADAVAAVDLTYGGIGARKSRGRGNSPLSYKLQIAGMMLLHKLTLGVVPKPALLRLMSGDNVPYSTARNFNFYYEKIICVTGLALVCAPVIAWYKMK